MEAEQAMADKSRDLELKEIKIESLQNIVKKREGQKETEKGLGQ